MIGAYRVVSCDTQDGNVQLGIQWTKDRGWSCFTAPTLIGCMTQVWTQAVMLEKIREERSCGQDTPDATHRSGLQV